MNDTFNMNRFWLLVRRQWTENKKIYLLLWGVISLSILVLTPFTDRDNELDILYFWLFWLGGCVMTTTLFSRWSDFGRSSLYLLLPASSTEKLLCGLFYGLILFIPLFSLNLLFIRYILTYLLIMLVPNNLVPFSSFIESGISEIATTFHFCIFLLLTFLFAQSLCMITFIRFRKRQMLIFLMILMAILIIYNIGMKILMSQLAHIPGGIVFTPGLLLPYFNLGFGYTGLSGNPPVSEYFTFIKLIRNLNNLIFLVVFFILYLTALYKLKEREL